MSKPNDRDWEVCREHGFTCGGAINAPRMLAGYREECVKAERERVLLAIEAVMVCSPWQYAEETVEQLRVVLERLEKGE